VLPATVAPSNARAAAVSSTMRPSRDIEEPMTVDDDGIPLSFRDAFRRADAGNAPAAPGAADGRAAAKTTQTLEGRVAAALRPHAATLLDLTLGRFQVIRHDPRAVPPFLHMLETDVLAASAPPPTTSPPPRPPTARRASELFLRSISTELITDFTKRGQQVQALQGVIKRRDALLNEQRRAYFRELLHLRHIIKQWEEKGGATVRDATFYQWDQDELGKQIEEEQEAKLEAAPRGGAREAQKRTGEAGGAPRGGFRRLAAEALPGRVAARPARRPPQGRPWRGGRRATRRRCAGGRGRASSSSLRATARRWQPSPPSLSM